MTNSFTETEEPPEVADEFNKYRSRYIAFYRATCTMVNSTVPNDQSSPLSEYLVHRSATFETSDVFGLLRWDIVEFSRSAKPLGVSIGAGRDTTEHAWLWHGSDLVARPFDWSCCRIRLPGRPLWLGLLRSGVPSVLKLTESVLPWLENWIDAEDRNDRLADGWKHCIHACAKPRRTDNGVVIDIDLGTAPISALTGLIDVCRSLNANPIYVEPGPTGGVFDAGASKVVVRDQRAKSAVL